MNGFILNRHDGPRSIKRLVIRLLRCTAALAVLSGVAAVPARADDPTGSWQTQMGDAQIRIAPCSKSAVCGTVAWLRDTVDPSTGQPPVDSKNPDPAKRNRKILGIRIFIMEPDGNGAYKGDIYNADDGKTYRGRLVPRGHADLEVQGCNEKNLCGSELWSRVDDPPATPAADPSANHQKRK
jgi:uncharacterized protein (DUF2147 family)